MNEFYPDGCASSVCHETVPPINPKNPFCNPTENENYNKEYTDIVPQLTIPGCRIPLEPSKAEKKRIRKHFNIAGSVILIHFAATNILAFVLILILRLVLSGKLPDADNATLSAYINNSSAYMGATLLIFLFCNLAAFFFGCKAEKIKFSSLFQTEKLTVPAILQYISIGFMLQYASALMTYALQYLCPDINLISEAMDTFSMPARTYIVYACYACIVAPITEELLYRGFVLKTCSRVSQRFGIFISAALFGLAHGNAAQFILAFFVGVFMAHIDIKHNSLIPSICVHFCINTLSTVIGLFMRGDSISIPFIIGLIEICIAATGFVMLIFFRRKNKLPFTMPHQKMRGGSVAACSWAMLLSFILLILVFIMNLFIG
ncbi:MAG: lysostaphin resistance A-like protein [Porcipelethomonas sp.]